MTEFPWDIKKSSDGKPQNTAPSAPELPAFLTGKSGGSGGASSPGPSIPDILANAFSSAPMEEVKIEVPSFGNKSGEQPSPSEALSFQNADDISALFNKMPGTSGPAGDVKPTVMPQFPPAQESPFLRAPVADIQQKKADLPPLKDAPGIGQVPFNDAKTLQADATKPKPAPKSGNRSPPPLFQLKLPEDEAPGIKLPDPSGKTNPEMPAFPFTPGGPTSSDNVSQCIASFPGAISGDPISSLSNSLPEYVPPSPDPFKSTMAPPVGSFPSPIHADSFPSPQGQQQNPFAGPVSSQQAVPSVDQVQLPGGPFSGQAQPPFNPFGSPQPQMAASSQNQPPNPFSGQMPPSSTPFAGQAMQSSNPFAAQSPSPTATSFPGAVSPSSAPFNPFAGAVQAQRSVSSGPVTVSSHGPKSSQGSKSLLLKADVLRKNFDGAGTAVKSLFKGLVAGKSLIERMEAIRDDSVSSPGISENHSPFEPGSVSADPFAGMTGKQAGPVAAAIPVASVSPFGRDESDIRQPVRETPASAPANAPVTPPVSITSDSFRKITPIEEPLMELKEEHRIDLFSEDEYKADVPSLDTDIVKTVPLRKDSIEHTRDRIRETKKDPDSVFPEDMLSGDAYEQIEEFSLELGGMKAELGKMMSRFADIEGSVFSLSTGMEDFGCTVTELKEGEQRFSESAARLDFLDERLGSLENGLGTVRAESSDVRATLARIEESISELVSSYTALLVQMHESAQENDVRFSQIETAITRLSPLEERIHSLERSHGESQSMSMELAKSISSLMTDLGTTSEDLREFKEASELNQSKLKENLNLMTEYVDSELRKIGARSYKGYGQNVHLSGITKNSTNMKLCMEWLEFLMGLVGRNNLPDILSYYEELGWITEQVRSELMHYAEGIDFYMEKPDWKLTPDDHVKSIWFIESLAGLKVDKNRLSVIDRDIEKVKKGTEIYGI